MTGTASSGGKNKKSAASHRLNGTYQPGRHGATLTAPEGTPEAPEGMSAAPRAHWDHIIWLMTEAMTLAKSDGPLIAQLAELLALADRLQAEADDGPVCFPKPVNGGESLIPMLSPSVAQLARVRASTRAFFVELGLTPSSRDRVTTQWVTEDDAEAEKRQKYFFGPRSRSGA